MVWWDDETEKTEDEGFPGLSPSAVLDRLVKWGWLSSDFDEKLNCYIIGFPEYSRLYAELFDRLGKRGRQYGAGEHPVCIQCALHL